MSNNQPAASRNKDPAEKHQVLEALLWEALEHVVDGRKLWDTLPEVLRTTLTGMLPDLLEKHLEVFMGKLCDVLEKELGERIVDEVCKQLFKPQSQKEKPMAADLVKVQEAQNKLVELTAKIPKPFESLRAFVAACFLPPVDASTPAEDLEKAVDYAERGLKLLTPLQIALFKVDRDMVTQDDHICRLEAARDNFKGDWEKAVKRGQSLDAEVAGLKLQLQPYQTAAALKPLQDEMAAMVASANETKQTLDLVKRAAGLEQRINDLQVERDRWKKVAKAAESYIPTA